MSYQSTNTSTENENSIKDRSDIVTRKLQRKLALSIGLIVFISSVISQTFSAISTYYFMIAHYSDIPARKADGGYIITSSVIIFLSILFLVCISAGLICAFFIIKLPLRPLSAFVEVINSLADGNFSVRLDTNKKHINFKPFFTLASSLNRLAEELESNEMFKSDFINNFSHEFKTPIVSIKGFAKLLKSGNLSDEDRDSYLDIIIEESNRLSNLSENVLNLSKLEKQTIQTSNSHFNFAELVRRDILMLESKWSQKDISFDIDLDEISFYGDSNLLSQVCINLIDNAIKFSPKKGDIRISLKRSEDENRTLILTVSDNGIGMDEDTVSRIFDKFYQADHSHSTEGNGLGLTVVKRIIEMNKGEISVNTAPNEGCSFTVIL